jgi:hypothetical protein
VISIPLNSSVLPGRIRTIIAKQLQNKLEIKTEPPPSQRPPNSMWIKIANAHRVGKLRMGRRLLKNCAPVKGYLMCVDYESAAVSCFNILNWASKYGWLASFRIVGV